MQNAKFYYVQKNVNVKCAKYIFLFKLYHTQYIFEWQIFSTCKMFLNGMQYAVQYSSAPFQTQLLTFYSCSYYQV